MSGLDERVNFRKQNVTGLRDMVHGGPVTRIFPDGKIDSQPATYFESIPACLKNHGRAEKHRREARQ